MNKAPVKRLISLAVGAVLVSSVAGAADFGQKVEQLAKAQALQLFGILGTLGASSSTQVNAATANADGRTLLTVAPGLTVKVVSAASTGDPLTSTAPNIDQMVLWPNATTPTHIIACNEQGAAQVGVQRIDLATGAAATIIAGSGSGLVSCDPVRLTPWGTIVVGEENGTSSRIVEILDPLATTGVTFTSATTTSDPTHVQVRPALGTFSFEGIGILPNGTVYLTDENRPGGGGIGNPGGAIVKFIPSTLWTGGPPISDLSQSPWNAGSLFGLRIGRNGGNTDVGQGNEFGRGYWVAITGTAPINLRAAASTLKLTSYYRPEDMSVDPKQLALGNVRFCGTNTGQDTTITDPNADNHFGEVYCVTDGTVTAAATNTPGTGPGGVTTNTSTIPEYQVLILGTQDMAMPDNIDIQPGRGNFLINEDGDGPGWSPPRNNDIWDCLDDGADLDHLSDACVKVATLNDLTAEPTGGFFDATGTRYFVSIQHNVTGHGVILEVNGWQP